MMLWGPFGFGTPALLLALAALPALWWLLKLLPPTPRRIIFPALALLKANQHQEAQSKPPWWLLALRCAIAALLVLSASSPIWRPSIPANSALPLVVLLDNGWSAAGRWPLVQERTSAALRQLADEQRAIYIVPTAPPAGGWPATPVIDRLTSTPALKRVNALKPMPWATDIAMLDRQLAALPKRAEILWVRDGVTHAGTPALARRLQSFGPVSSLIVPGTPLALRQWRAHAKGWQVEAVRVPQAQAQKITLIARDYSNRVLGQTALLFPASSARVQGLLELPATQRTAVARLEIAGETSAAAVALISAGAGRPVVGLVSEESIEERQPLRSALFYLRRALEPHADTIEGSILDVLDKQPNMLILADVGKLAPQTEATLKRWLTQGGLLLQFAGPRMAESGASLAPVVLRRASRAFGGALSWGEPLKLRAFLAGTPFFGLALPADTVVQRQVLAEPAADLAAKSWGVLADGTAFITAGRLGQGLSVLVHTTASPEWTNLPLSPVFEGLLTRLIPLAGNTTRALPAPRGNPYILAEALDEQGAPSAPQGFSASLAANMLAQAKPSALTPPGRYRSDGAEHALNIADTLGPTNPLEAASRLVGWRTLTPEPAPYALGPWLLLLAGLLFVVDTMLTLWLRHSVPGWQQIASSLTLRLAKKAAIASCLIMPFLLVPPSPATAQNIDFLSPQAPRDIPEDTHVFLGYVASKTNSTAPAGLRVLTQTIIQRTAIELGAPVAVDLERTPLGRIAMLYWPIPANPAPLSAKALASLSRYLANGGLILLDTGSTATQSARQSQALRALIGPLGIPRLDLMRPDHVLAKSFYLLSQTPTPLGATPIWVESSSQTQAAGGKTGGQSGQVTSVVFSAGDWAQRWAGSGVNPATQETSLRFGVNLVMYALTGTYKADQVHAAALLRRLEQERSRAGTPNPRATP